MNIKMTITSQLSTMELKKNHLSIQAEQKQKHRTGDHMEGYQQGMGREGAKIQRISSTNGR